MVLISQKLPIEIVEQILSFAVDSPDVCRKFSKVSKEFQKLVPESLCEENLAEKFLKQYPTQFSKLNLKLRTNPLFIQKILCTRSLPWSDVDFLHKENKSVFTEIIPSMIASSVIFDAPEIHQKLPEHAHESIGLVSETLERTNRLISNQSVPESNQKITLLETTFKEISESDAVWKKLATSHPLKYNRHIFLLGLRDGGYLSFADANVALKNDKEIVTKAVLKSYENFQHVGEKLKKDAQFCSELLKNMPDLPESRIRCLRRISKFMGRATAVACMCMPLIPCMVYWTAPFITRTVCKCSIKMIALSPWLISSCFKKCLCNKGHDK